MVDTNGDDVTEVSVVVPAHNEEARGICLNH